MYKIETICMYKLTKNQEIVLTIIQNYIHQNGHSPLLSELQILLQKKGLRVASINSISQYLKALEEKGYIKRDYRKKRGIYLLKKSPEKVIRIPLLGMADCGEPLSFANNSIDCFVNVSKKFIKGDKNEYFIIQAVGDSMNKVGIEEKDYVLVRTNQRINNGDIVVAVIDDCGTIKKYKSTYNSIILLPCSTNSVHKPIFLHPNDQYVISGKVEQIFKNHN